MQKKTSKEMELSKDRQRTIATANYWSNFNKPYPDGNVTPSRKITDIIRTLYENNQAHGRYCRETIDWEEYESIGDAIHEVCNDLAILEGLDSDCFNSGYRIDGFDVDIYI